MSDHSASGNRTISSEPDVIATYDQSDIDSDGDSDFDLDLSSDVPPSPKQSRLEEKEVSIFNIDVADVAERRSVLTETEKYDFYCNHVSPGQDYKFPRVNSRSFRYQYLQRYKWLIYSQKKNGGYCLPCVLFSRSIDCRKGKGKGKGTFVEMAFTNFKKTYDICDAFIERMSSRQESVVVQLRSELRDTIQKNRQKLHSIVETIVLCGRQNLALRGHHDSGTDVEGVQSASRNHGNFRALLDFRVSAGDTTLGEHLEKAGRNATNATYTSPDIQNQIISILGDQIGEKILRKVRSSACYTVIADEVTDCSILS